MQLVAGTTLGRIGLLLLRFVRVALQSFGCHKKTSQDWFPLDLRSNLLS